MATPQRAVPQSASLVHQVTGQVFTNQSIPVDGYTFTECRFEGCQIVFAASAPVNFDKCIFQQCDWSFIGAADLMLRYLAALYGGLGPPGQEIVEMVFESVRRGLIGQSGTITHEILQSR